MNKEQLLNLLKSKGLWAKKSFSQNFLIDESALEKIVKTADLEPRDLVIEIGPGLGILTKELVQEAKEVIAIELDKELAFSIQTSNFIPQNDDSKLKVVNEDFLKVNLNDLVGDRSYKVVANIPYHITSKIIEKLMTAKNQPESITLLVQKEVAERICAKPGEMSILSVSVQLYGKPRLVATVPSSSFFPEPKVDSAILKIECIAKPEGLNEKMFFQCVKIGYSSRRKTLANNLSAGYRISKEEASDIIMKIGFNPMVRAQELSVEDWKKLVNLMNDI